MLAAAVLGTGEVVSNALSALIQLPRRLIERCKEAQEKHRLKEKYAKYKRQVEEATGKALGAAKEQVSKTKAKLGPRLKRLGKYAQDVKEKYYEAKKQPETEKDKEEELKKEDRMNELKEILRKYLEKISQVEEEEGNNLIAVSDEEVPKEDL